MAKAKRKSKAASWAKRKSKAMARKAWTAVRKRAKARRAERKKLRKQRREQRKVVRTTRRNNPTNSQGRQRGNFWARHPWLADARDWAEVSAHSVLDRRDFRSGLITEEELEALEKYDSQEEWARDMREMRRQAMLREAARRRDEAPGARLSMVYAHKGSSPATVRHVGFRPPAPRPAPQKAGAFSPPAPRPVRRVRRKDHIPQIVKHWEPMLDLNSRRAMAADADLSAAVQSLQAFAESFPERRSEVHDHLGKMAQFGQSYAAAMDTFMATLREGKGDANPGMPPEVVDRLKPLADVGDTIRQACNEMIAAWEDYFQDAIKAAQDEHTPSKQALTS